MAPKNDLVYFRGRSKSIAPLCRQVIGLDDDDDSEYMQLGTRTPTRDARTTRGTPFGSAAGSEGYSGFEEAYESEEISTSHSPIVTNTPVSALSNEADFVDFTPAPLTDVPTPIADQHNRWYVEGQYHVYRDAKLLNDKVVMTRTLTVE